MVFLRVVLSKDGSNGVTNPILIITLIILFLIEGMMLPYFSAESKIKYIYATILPCYILYVSLPRQEIIRYFKMFAKLLTIASTVVVLCGIVDTYIGTSIGKTIAEFSAADVLCSALSLVEIYACFIRCPATAALSMVFIVPLTASLVLISAI